MEKEKWEALLSSAKLMHGLMKGITRDNFTNFQEEIKKRTNTLKEAIDALEGSSADTEFPTLDTTTALQESRPFADFLSDIGESVVQTQRQLDQQSIDYLTSIRDRPYIPPTLFRIPKITAELKVALERKENTGLNVILVSRQREMRELHEQSLRFDIAAVPPFPRCP